MGSTKEPGRRPVLRAIFQRSETALFVDCCSDRPGPGNEITATDPGEIFVHRNIANMVVHTDMSMLSVLDYAVNVLEVPHVVCADIWLWGNQASMGQKHFGLIDNWIRHIKDAYTLHHRELETIRDRRNGKIV